MTRACASHISANGEWEACHSATVNTCGSFAFNRGAVKIQENGRVVFVS